MRCPVHSEVELATGGCFKCGPSAASQTVYDFTPKGWICPKCSKVYSPTTPECCDCNRSVDSQSKTCKCQHLELSHYSQVDGPRLHCLASMAPEDGGKYFDWEVPKRTGWFCPCEAYHE